MRLEFGNPEHIRLRDKAIEDNIIAKLLPKVRCPLCRAKATEAYTIDLEEKYIGWNFNCDKTCPNSLEYAEKHGYEDSETHTNLRGKFITEPEDVL